LGSVQQQIGVFECGNGLCRMELGWSRFRWSLVQH
jgi:hypothetical protein